MQTIPLCIAVLCFSCLKLTASVTLHRTDMMEKKSINATKRCPPLTCDLQEEDQMDKRENKEGSKPTNQHHSRKFWLLIIRKKFRRLGAASLSSNFGRKNLSGLGEKIQRFN